jgi:hypothetical protein
LWYCCRSIDRLLILLFLSVLLLCVFTYCLKFIYLFCHPCLLKLYILFKFIYAVALVVKAGTSKNLPKMLGSKLACVLLAFHQRDWMGAACARYRPAELLGIYPKCSVAI